MRTSLSVLFILLAVVVTGGFQSAQSQPVSDCLPCHQHYGQMMWPNSPHAHTQADVALGLDSAWVGLPPDSVINGTQASNCVGCHAPRAVTLNGTMSETQVLNYFFSTSSGLFTDTTRSLNATVWPDVTCKSCHDVETLPHPTPINVPLRLYNSTTASYDSVRNASELCGKCHGGLRFANAEYQPYEAWQLSKHGHGGQSDVAHELAAEWVGRTPAEVISSADSNNCVACHAPTATKLDGGISETQVLSRFFTLTNGRFTANTAVTDTAHWPDLACNACHDPHQPDSIAIYNSTTSRYVYPLTQDQQCGQCHGNLRFAYSDHLTYNIEQGTGGVGVPNQVTMPGTHCLDCHMHRSTVNGSNSKVHAGHSWAVFETEADSSVTASCTACHAGMSADSARARVGSWQREYTLLTSQATLRVALADTALQGSTDSLRLRNLNEAKRNLAFAMGDESGGAHNHNYEVALLNDVISKADIILGAGEVPVALPARFALFQNYPNPFNPTTEIKFTLAAQSPVRISVYNSLGEQITTLVNSTMPAGSHTVRWNGEHAASGIYFYRMEAGAFTDIRKMLLIR